MKDSFFYYFFRFIKWKFGEKSPIIASLKVTQKCNLSCSHCPWKNKILADLPFDEWKKIIRRVCSLGCTVVTFEGGEPTLRSDLQDLIDYASFLGLKTIVVTNGTQDISKIAPDRVWISIDGYGEAHDQIRGKGTFEKALETIKKNQDKKIVTLTTISKTNYQDIELLCEALFKYVHGFVFSFLYPYGDTKDIALGKREKMQVSEKIIALKRKYNNILTSRSFLNSVGKGWKCYPWALISVTADGKFSRGCMVEHLEPCNCELCDMACYGELAQAMKLKFDAARFFMDVAGANLK
jgi:MoaA/NifB/PqqE/SkfB family radical SAM enzyme